MWHEYRRRLSTTTAMIALLGALSATSWAQDKSPDNLSAGIEYHERMLEQRTARMERVRAVVQKTAGEVAEVERKLGLERNPEEMQRLQVRLESLRLRMLRRTILEDRAELKRQELAEYINILKQEKDRGTPLPPEQSLQKRRDFLTRRLNRAESLMQVIREYHRLAVSDREKAHIYRLIKEQERLIADIRRATSKLNDHK